MKINLDTGSEGVRIEIIPLIDVVFCILIFFILAALQLTRQQAINVDLPSAGTATLQNQQMLMVSIDPIGRIYVDRSEVSEAQLYLVLEGYQRTNPLGLMVLYADRNAIYDDVVRVLDLMRSVGGDRVALATISPDATTPQNQLDQVPVDPQPLPFQFDPLSPNFANPTSEPIEPIEPIDPGTGSSEPGNSDNGEAFGDFSEPAGEAADPGLIPPESDSQ